MKGGWRTFVGSDSGCSSASGPGDRPASETELGAESEWTREDICHFYWDVLLE